MVGHNKLWVSYKGVAFDMQDPPRFACRCCGGDHWELFYPMANSSKQQWGMDNKEYHKDTDKWDGNKQQNWPMVVPQWGPHMQGFRQRQATTLMQAHATQGIRGGGGGDHIAQQCLQAVYREQGIHQGAQGA